MADVTIFEHANFEGRSQVLTKGRFPLEEIAIGNDTLSSLKVSPGLVARLYEHFHFQGRFIDVKEDTTAISQFWNDRTSSIIVYGEDEQPPVTKEVMIFEHANHTGRFQILPEGEYDVAEILIGNDILSSALVPSGMKLRLYEHASFQGAFLDIREDTRAVSLDWNDRASSIVVGRDFPENEIEILPDFLSDDLNTLWGPMGTALSASDISITGQITGPNANLVNQIRSARRRLAQFLNHAATLMALGTFGKQFKNREFDAVLNTIGGLAEFVTVSRVLGFGEAFRTAPVIFREILGGNPEGGPVFSVQRTLPGYGGPIPDSQQRTQILAWSSFLSADTEQRFLVKLLQAEANAGLRSFDEAIKLYDALLTTTPSGSPRHKFVAIRSAFARLALADQLFRKQCVLSDQARQDISGVYDTAVRLLQEKEVSPDNPRRQQIEAHVSQQKAKLQSRLNYLGLWDAFVPVQTYATLEKLAHGQIDNAKEAGEKFFELLKEAEQAIEAQRDVEFQESQEELGLDILEKRQANATLGVVKIKEQISSIDDQRDFLSSGLELLSHGARAIVAGIGAGSGQQGNPPLGLATAAVGIGGAVVNLLDQREQLAHQRRMAEIEQQIAQNEVLIARAESEISQHRLDFYKQKRAFLANKRLNADFLYLLAELEEQRAERRLDVAIFLAYLYERAVTFFLGKTNIRHIQFDYLDRAGGIFLAHKDLRDDFELVRKEFAKVTQERFGFFEEIISLRESYPIEFFRFQQTGEMEFVYSLYHLSKRRPASHQCRLREVGVEVVGLIPPTGFSGTLTHHGRFLVRDKTTTLDPNATRLVPTDEQLAQALEEQRQQGLSVAAVGGVLYYDLEPNTKQLSMDTRFVSPPPETFTLDLLEGHGPTGLWRLKIVDHGRLSISDILLHFAIVSRDSDTFELEPKVEALIRSYESELAQGDQLDRFSVFSLRQNFPNTFFALQTGSANLSLGEENFPDGLTNLQFKMVIAQALDQEGKGVPGVALEIGRQDVSFNQTGVTLSDGFSEDLDAPPQTLPRDQRFPVIGAWQIRLSNPAQFALLGDLRLFFMYAFEEL